MLYAGKSGIMDQHKKELLERIIGNFKSIMYLSLKIFKHYMNTGRNPTLRIYAYLYTLAIS